MYVCKKVKVSCSTRKALRYGSHSFACNYTNACLCLVSIHQMAPPQTEVRTSNCSLLLIYLPRKDERLSWLADLQRMVYHISSHPSAAGRAQDRESSPVKEQRSTTVPCNQPICVFVCVSVCLSVCLSVCMYVCVFVCRSSQQSCTCTTHASSVTSSTTSASSRRGSRSSTC